MTEFIDSFGIYVTSSAGASQRSLYKRWNGIGIGSGSLAVVPATGHRGNPALFIPFGGAIYKTLSHQQTFTVGFRLNMSSVAGVGGGDLIQFQNVDRIMCTLKVNADGSILVYANNDVSKVICTTGVAIIANTDCYLELQSTISGTSNVNVSGHVKVYDATDTLVANASGNVNTGVSTNALATLTGLFGMDVVPFFAAVYNRIGLLAGCVTNGQSYISDFYLNTSAGTTNLGFLGPVAIDAYPLPNGDGATLGWTPKSGGVHYTQINELPSDEGTTYVEAASAPLTDTYNWQDIASFVGTVKTVQVSFDGYSTDEGFCAVQSVVGNTGSEAQSDPLALPGSYLYRHYAFDLDPATGLAWTWPTFNAKQFGVLRSS